jgi:cyclopropane fatty-acyl-phospholipid synthase-like methyltransferase
MNQDWIQQHSLGGNTYMLTQRLIEQLLPFKIRRILDLGGGKCLSAILLAEKLGAEVWAVDKNINVSENYQMLRQFKALPIIPLQLDVNHLPFAHGYFDCIVSINSIQYFGTDDKFLPYICRFLTQDGIIAITDICFTNEVSNVEAIPSFLKADFFYFFQHVHSLEWWKNKWDRTGLLDIVVAEHCTNSSALKQAYIRMTKTEPDAFSKALQLDDHNTLDFFMLIGKKNALRPFLDGE